MKNGIKQHLHTITSKLIKLHILKCHSNAPRDYKMSQNWHYVRVMTSGFPTVNSRIYCSEVLTLSNQMSLIFANALEYLMNTHYWVIVWPSIYHTVKFLNSRTPKNCCNYHKTSTIWIYHRVMIAKDADGMANSADPDQTVLLCPKIEEHFEEPIFI